MVSASSLDASMCRTEAGEDWLEWSLEFVATPLGGPFYSPGGNNRHPNHS
jgi:hypothetical protein